MKIRPTVFLLILIIAAGAIAQDVDPAERNARWREFNKNNFQQFDFAKTRLTKARLSKLKENEAADDFALLRGVVFGKHGRIFKERSIQDYLEKQAWYKANKSYSNSMLKPIELSLIHI